VPCQQALRCAKLLAAICTSVIVFILHCYLGRGALPDLIFPLLFFFFLNLFMHHFVSRATKQSSRHWRK